MRISSENEFVTKMKKIVQVRFFAIWLSWKDVSASNNFEDSSTNNFEKFNDLSLNKFESFL